MHGHRGSNNGLLKLQGERSSNCKGAEVGIESLTQELATPDVSKNRLFHTMKQ